LPLEPNAVKALNQKHIFAQRLAQLDRGGDFADGVIAAEGELLGGTEFVSFDQQAIHLLKAQKRKARLLA
jgi:predicted nucleic-acid-binding protein